MEFYFTPLTCSPSLCACATLVKREAGVQADAEVITRNEKVRTSISNVKLHWNCVELFWI